MSSEKFTQTLWGGFSKMINFCFESKHLNFFEQSETKLALFESRKNFGNIVSRKIMNASPSNIFFFGLLDFH